MGMTREEALNWIVARKEHYELGEETQELAEALSIAISDMKKLDRIEKIAYKYNLHYLEQLEGFKKEIKEVLEDEQN